jgi:thiol-disulfide isomerase/thioredoxin
LATDSTSDDSAPAPESASGGSFWALLVLLIAAAATLIALQSNRQRPAGGSFVGQPLPPLDSAGWINTKTPLTAEDLRGKIVLVDFWASDCIPCVQELPGLIEFNKRYRDLGVVLIGLSLETGARATHLKNLIETREGLDWPVGYGAQMAYEVLGVYGTPTYYLFDRSGRSVWGGHSLLGLENAVASLLAKK